MRSKLLLPLIVASLIAVAVAGCGGDEAATPAPAEPTPAEPAPAEPTPAEPAPAEPTPAEPAPAEPTPAEPAPAEPTPAEPTPAEPAPAEPAPADLQTSLVVLEPDVAPGMDTDGATAPAPEHQEANLNILEPLVAYPFTDNGAGVLEPDYAVGPDGFAPRLAESWTSTENADGTVTWTLKLRQGVTSCAGNTFTADDVIWTFQRAKSVSGASPVGWFLGNVSAIFDLSPLAPTGEGDEVTEEDKALLDTEVRKVDDYTVEVTQRNPNDLFPRVLTLTFMGIYDSKAVIDNTAADDPWGHQYSDTQGAPGFGAYCLKTWNKGSEVILEANPNYYGDPKPQFTTVTIRKVPQSANRVAAIINGDADVIVTLAPQEIASLRQEDTVSVLGWQNNRILTLGLSYNFEPWSLETNRQVRQAIAYALPYDEIIAEDFGGDAKRWNGLISSRYYGYVDQPIYNTDVEKAKQLLVDAGFPEGQGLDQYADGLKLFYVAERANVLEPIANRIRTALAGIGINITLNPISNAEYADRSLTKFDLPMFLADVDRPLAPDVGYGSLLFFVSKDKGGLNVPFGYSNPEFDELYAQSAAIAGDGRLPILQQMQELLMQDLPGVPLAEPASFIAVKKGVVNCWAGQPYDLTEFRFLRTADSCG